MDSSENWLLAGDVMIGYGKQWLEKGRVMQQTTLTTEGKGMGFDEDDLIDDLTSSLKKHAFYNLLINNILYLCVT